MADRSLRGIRLGAQSLQSEEGVVLHERSAHTYVCSSCEGTTTLAFAVDADVPDTWECRSCGAEALRCVDGPEPKKVKPPRTHWDMLLERRSLPELEELLQERLALLRERRGSTERLSA
mgnify:CR=1 FL=1